MALVIEVIWFYLVCICMESIHIMGDKYMVELLHRFNFFT